MTPLRLRSVSIRGQLLQTLMLTSASVLLATVAALIVYERSALRGMLAERFAVLARVVADQSVAPLAFQNREDGEEVLATFSAVSGVQAAAIYDQQGRLFARLARDGEAVFYPSQPGPEGRRLGADHVEVFQSVTQAGNRLGMVYVRSDLSVIAWRIWAFGKIAFCVMLGALLMAYLLATKLQAVISSPVLALAETARAITMHKDYSKRAQELGAREIGVLTEAFNRMLDEIQQREAELAAAYDRARQRADEAESGRRLLSAIMDNINEGIVVTGGPPDFPIALVSRYGLELAGRPEGQLTGIASGTHQKAWGLFLPDGVTRPKPAEMPLYRATRLGEKVENMELVLQSAGGREYRLLVNATPIRDGTGAILGGINSWRDVTELKRAEAELRRLKDELEDRVQERTAALMEANREMEAFTYSVSHDLRAPLRHMMSFTRLLEKNVGAGLDDKSRRHIRLVIEAGQRMDTLIDELLKLSRVGRAPLTRAVISLRQLVDDARQQLSSEMAGREIEWKIGHLPRVWGDVALLTSVFVNLLSNALKYTRGRNPARIEIGCESKPGEVVCFVRDNGAGFDMRFVDKLFGIFQRLHRVEDFEGTGVGLASVRRIVQRHGGRTWAEGEIDRGATFYFSLPDS